MTTDTNTTDHEPARPVFSVSDRGDDIVMEMPEDEDLRLPRHTIGRSLAAVVVWAVLLFLAGPQLVIADNRDWWLILVVPIGLLIGTGLNMRVFGTMNRRYGRRSTAMSMAMTSLLLGISIGALTGAAWTAHRSTDADGLDPSVGFPCLFLAIAGGVVLITALVAVVRAWWGVRYATRQQHLMRRLRALDRRLSGVLVAVEFEKEWSNRLPMFTAMISVGEGADATVFTSHFVTKPTRVPLPGNRVMVRYDPQVPLNRAAMVELDPETVPRYDPDSDRYIEPTGS